MKLRRVWGLKYVCQIVMIALLCISVSAEELLIGGQTVGMKVRLDGLLVTSVENDSPAERAGLRSGDSVIAVGGVPLESVEQFVERVQSGSVLVLSVSRNGETRTLFIQPTQEADGYKLGASVREDLAGIGTVTYFHPETGKFGALGHGICDLGGTTLLKISGGVIVPSSVANVEKSKSGTAGQLQGQFETDRTIGTIEANTPYGVFGTLDMTDQERFETATEDLVHTGAASIRANVDGTEVREYRVEIVSKLPGAAHSGKDLLIRVTDSDLLATTGGIVQGMSGSPILQDGKLIGAVTHVLINSPEYGYGVFIQRMLETEKKSAMPTSFLSFRPNNCKFVENCRQKLAENSIFWIEIERKM